jgi:hypothetical protein
VSGRELHCQGDGSFPSGAKARKYTWTARLKKLRKNKKQIPGFARNDKSLRVLCGTAEAVAEKINWPASAPKGALKGNQLRHA